jgi:NAD(P)-dependent dehydrogenase (short-subunit alcohol dehydrogenase family)
MKIEPGMAAVVTGGASGLGKASAAAFAAAGM